MDSCYADVLNLELKQKNYDGLIDEFCEFLDTRVFKDELIKWHLKRFSKELDSCDFRDVLIQSAIK